MPLRFVDGGAFPLDRPHPDPFHDLGKQRGAVVIVVVE